MSYFRLDLTKSQIELLMALINVEHNLKREYNLRDISRIASLDYQGCLYRHKDWLIDNEILVTKNGGYKVDFNAIAELLFRKTNIRLIYGFAYRHLEYSI